MATATNGGKTAPKSAEKKLLELREEMAKVKVDAVVVPTADPHLMENVPDFCKRREFISGFSGSTGTAVITTSEAALWTDGRYFLQAEMQLGPGWTLMKMETKGCPEIPDWLCEAIPDGGRVGVDPFCHNDSQIRSWQKNLQEAGRELVLLKVNPVDVVWGSERPPPPNGSLRVHPIELAGESSESKFTRVREAMVEKGVETLVTADVSEVAWMLNLRGQDEPYTPIFISYLILTLREAILYVDTEKVTEEVRRHMEGLHEINTHVSVTEGQLQHCAAQCFALPPTHPHTPTPPGLGRVY